MLYWHVGLRIQGEVLKETRVSYGERIVATVSRQSASEYGKGCAEKILPLKKPYHPRIELPPKAR